MTIEQYAPRAELALNTAQDVAVQRLGEWAQSADAAYHVAERLSTSAFVPQQFRGKPVELTAAILSGLEVGLSPMAAMRSFDVIQGQAAPRAITLRAVVQAHGHELVLVESTATRCRMKGRRKGSDEWQAVTWTIDRARDLGLVGKDNWKKQPAAMLVARATSELARLIASDAILGIGYSAEEIADGGPTDAQVAEVTTTPASPSGSRKMSRRPAPVAEQVTPEPSDAEGERIDFCDKPSPHAPHADCPGVPNPPSSESPLLNTSSKLAKRMFALMGEVGLTEREGRLAYVSDVVGRQVGSSSEMTDADAEKVITAIEAELDQPFPEGGDS